MRIFFRNISRIQDCSTAPAQVSMIGSCCASRRDLFDTHSCLGVNAHALKVSQDFLFAPSFHHKRQSHTAESFKQVSWFRRIHSGMRKRLNSRRDAQDPGLLGILLFFWHCIAETPSSLTDPWLLSLLNRNLKSKTELLTPSKATPCRRISVTGERKTGARKGHLFVVQVCEENL
jgi:hypothetical protein